MGMADVWEEEATCGSRCSPTEIVYAVKQVELGIPVREIARKYGVSDKTVYATVPFGLRAMAHEEATSLPPTGLLLNSVRPPGTRLRWLGVVDSSRTLPSCS